MSSPQPLEVRVAVHEERIANLEEEQLRHRQRLHEIEGDRITVRLLAEQVRALAGNVEKVARQAALEAIDLSLEHRNELGNRRWMLRSQWAVAGATSGGLISAIILHFT